MHIYTEFKTTDSLKTLDSYYYSDDRFGKPTKTVQVGQKVKIR